MNARRSMILGAAGLLFAAPVILPVALADEPVRTLFSSASELLAPEFDPRTLVKWDYFVEPGVSVEPVRQSRIKKIAYGRASYVEVVQTESGIYSSDGLASANIEYPGIGKERATTNLGLWFWGGGTWQRMSPVASNSFVSIAPFEGGALVITEDGHCVVRPTSIHC